MTVFQLAYDFFQTFLIREKSLAPNTVASYAETVKQLLNFAAEKEKVDVHKLDLATFSDTIVSGFLDNVEEKNSVVTRNQRLGAISFIVQHRCSSLRNRRNQY